MTITTLGKFSLALVVAGALGYSTPEAMAASNSASYSPTSAIAGGTSNTAVNKTYSLTITAPGSLNDKGMADLTALPVLYTSGGKAGQVKVPVPNPEPGIVVGINASVIPPIGVSTETALGYLSVSTNTWNCLALGEKKTVEVTVNIPVGAVVGDYVYTISANPDDSGLGWGGGGHALTASVEQYVPNTPFVLDTTAPTVNITSPTATSFTYVIGGTPVNVAFEALEDKSPITSLSAAVGNSAVTLLPSGLGTTEASATGTATVNSIGTYTLIAKAQNTRALPNPNPEELSANLEGCKSVTFTVSYDMSNCWLPPLSLGKISKGGSTIPIKFTAKDANGLFIADQTVKVEVSEIVGDTAKLITTAIFGTGSSSVRIEKIDDYTGQYIVNFPTATGAHTYRADVFFKDVSCNYVQQGEGKVFSVSAK